MAIVTYASAAQSFNPKAKELMLAIRARGKFLDWIQEDDQTGEIVAYKVSGEPIMILKKGIDAANPQAVSAAQYELARLTRVPHTLQNGQSGGDIWQAGQRYPNGSAPSQMTEQARPTVSRGMAFYLAALGAALFIL